MIRKSVRYALRPKPLTRYLTYGALMASAQLTIVGIPLVFGYLIRVIKTLDEGDETDPPSFSPVDGLIYDGAMALLAIGVFIGIPASIVLTLQNPIANIVTSPTQQTAVLISQVIGTLVLIISSFMMPASLILYARHGTVSDALNFSDVLSVSLSQSYFGAWFRFLLLTVPIGLLVSGLSQLVFTVPIAFIFNFLVYVLFGYFFGQASRISRIRNTAPDNDEQEE